MNYHETNDELMHYGVIGMKWGIRRGTSQIAKGRETGNKDLYDRGMTTLNKHKAKINKKITSLDRTVTNLQSKRNKQMQVDDVKAAKISRKAAKISRRAIRPFTSASKADRLMRKANMLNIKSDAIRARSMETQALINKNKTRKLIFEKGLSDVDRIIMNNGETFVKKYS